MTECCRKYEEICAPQVEEFCYITDNTYLKDEVCVFLQKWDKISLIKVTDLGCICVSFGSSIGSWHGICCFELLEVWNVSANSEMLSKVSNKFCFSSLQYPSHTVVLIKPLNSKTRLCRRFVRAAHEVHEAPLMQLECMSNYIAELSLLEYTMLSYSPSLVAASSIFLAKYILDPTRRPWVRFLHFFWSVLYFEESM